MMRGGDMSVLRGEWGDLLLTAMTQAADSGAGEPAHPQPLLPCILEEAWVLVLQDS